jgi:transcriptional regulator with XRE-family HTH domain
MPGKAPPTLPDEPSRPDDLSRALTLLRAARGWSQQELARAAGVQASSISNYERGKSRPQQKTLAQLVAAMGFPLSSIGLTRGFCESLRAAGGLETQPDDPIAARIHAVSAEAGKAVTQLVTSLFSFLLRELPRKDGEASELDSPGPAASFLDSPALDSPAAAEKLWAALREKPFHQQEELVRNDRAFRTEGLFDLLCQESERLGPHDPKQAVAAAGLAVLVATGLHEEKGRGARRVAIAQARRANAVRISGSLPLAEEGFAEAERWWSRAEAAGEPARLNDEARILSQLASLRMEQRRIPETLEILDRAFAAAETGELKAIVLIQRARALGSLRRLEEAIDLLREAEPLVDCQGSPRLLLCLRHNRLHFLAELGRFQEAMAQVPRVRALAQKLGNDLDLLRLRWLEAKIEAGLGWTGKAIETLTQVRKELAARGIVYDVALATLDLTVLYAQTGWASEVEILVRRLVPLFEAQGVPQGASAALELLRRAVEK